MRSKETEGLSWVLFESDLRTAPRSAGLVSHFLPPLFGELKKSTFCEHRIEEIVFEDASAAQYPSPFSCVCTCAILLVWQSEESLWEPHLVLSLHYGGSEDYLRSSGLVERAFTWSQWPIHLFFVIF